MFDLEMAAQQLNGGHMEIVVGLRIMDSHSCLQELPAGAKFVGLMPDARCVRTTMQLNEQIGLPSAACL